MAGLSCVHVPRAFLVSRKSFLVVGLWDRYCYRNHCQGDRFSLTFSFSSSVRSRCSLPSLSKVGSSLGGRNFDVSLMIFNMP